MQVENQDHLFIYILSNSYSGSTLLTFLLATHPNIATIGELKGTAIGDIESYLCSCGQRLLECPFWQNVKSELNRCGVDFNVGDFQTDFRCQSHRLVDRLLRGRVRSFISEWARTLAVHLLPRARRTLNTILQRNRDVVEAVKKVQGKPIFLDGSKDPLRLRWLLRIPRWRIKVIYLMRDGYGAANSYMRHHNTTMTIAASEWTRTQKSSARMLSRLRKNDWIKIYYEDLCRDPEGTMAQVFNFLGQDPSLWRRDFRSVEHHILGNTMRLDSSSQIVLDEKWKTLLSDKELGIFEQIAGELNRSHGYA